MARKASGNDPIPIDKLTIKKGNWIYDRRLHENLVAKSWGVDLERWYNMDEDVRAEHVAVYELENEMRAYDEQEQERESRRQRSK